MCRCGSLFHANEATPQALPQKAMQEVALGQLAAGARAATFLVNDPLALPPSFSVILLSPSPGSEAPVYLHRGATAADRSGRSGDNGASLFFRKVFDLY